MKEPQVDNNTKIPNTTNPDAPANPSPTPNNPANKDAVQFNSAMSTKAGQPKDYFAEQNQKRQDELIKRRKRTKVSIILVSVILVVLIVTGIILQCHLVKDCAR